METHSEIIQCPNCGSTQEAQVLHTIPFYTYFHTCQLCLCEIQESELNEVTQTQKTNIKKQVLCSLFNYKINSKL